MTTTTTHPSESAAMLDAAALTPFAVDSTGETPRARRRCQALRGTIRTGPGSEDENVKPLPGSAVAARALDEANAALPPSLLAHSTRTFLLARAFAERRSITFDEEGLFVAAMLHDLGLVPSLRDGAAPFPQVGSRRLVTLFTEEGQPADRGADLARAIDLHMRWFPRWSAGPEAGLLQVGAWMDVVGRRRWQVPATVRADIDASYPRGDLGRRFPASVIASIGSWRACAGLLVP